MNKARLSIGDYFVLFLKGRLVYAYGILPFSDADARKRTRRVSLDGEIKDTSHREWHYLKRRWSYYLGGALSTLLLFSVPFVELDTNFHYAMVIGLGVFVVPSLRNALLSFFLQGRKEKQDYIRSSIVFVFTFILCLLLSFIKEPTFSENGKYFPFALLGLFTIGFFFFSYAGLGPTSLLFLSGILLPFSEKRRNGIYEGRKTRTIYTLFLLIARSVGRVTGYLAKTRTEALPERTARKAAILFAGFIYCFAFQLKGDVYNSYTTKTAQKITLVCVPLAFFFFAFILVLPQIIARKGRKKNSL